MWGLWELEIIYVNSKNKRKIGKAVCGVVIKSLKNLVKERLRIAGQVGSEKALKKKMNFGKSGGDL